MGLELGLGLGLGLRLDLGLGLGLAHNSLDSAHLKSNRVHIRIRIVIGFNYERSEICLQK